MDSELRFDGYVQSAHCPRGPDRLLTEQRSGDDSIGEQKEEKKNEEECPTTELARLVFEFTRVLAREIEVRDQMHEERRLDSEQTAYMEGVFMCEFIYSNL